MSRQLPSHPDRQAVTLAVRDREAAGAGPFALPGAGSDDARVPLKLLAARTRAALAAGGTPAAHARLADLQTADVWAGTVRDGVARGFAVALEEAISLCQPAAAVAQLEFDPSDELGAKDLRRRRELVVRSGGSRVRFSRKGGISLIDRANEAVTNDCIRFEDRADCGDLDGFAPLEGERPRLFSPGFLQPVAFAEAPRTTRLRLAGRLGRRPDGFPCEVLIVGDLDAPGIRMNIRIHNERLDHRLRIRFLGPLDAVFHAGTTGWESVHARGRTFRAATLVRACGRLRVENEIVAVPDAQCPGWIEHAFLLGCGWEGQLNESQGWQRAPDLAD